MSIFNRKFESPMPERFQRLADYNGEVGRGIVHTGEYDTRMAELQKEFNQWSSEKYAGYIWPEPHPTLRDP